MKRIIFVLLAFMMSAGMAHATYKATLKLEVGTVKGGFVLAANSQQTNPSITATSSSANQTGGSGLSTNDTGSVTLYAYAKAKDDYTFVGWSTSQDGSNGVIADNPATLSLSAAHVRFGQGDGTVHTYYAIFEEKKSYYMSIRVVADETLGKAIASLSEDKMITTASSEENSFTAYFAAEATAEGYDFKGWSEQEGGDIISEENPFMTVFTSESTDPDNPTVNTLYANFAQTVPFTLKATATSDGNGKAQVSFPGTAYAATQVFSVESAGSSASATAYFKATANDGYAFDYWEDENGTRYTSVQCDRRITSTDPKVVTEVCMTAHFKEYAEPEPEPEVNNSEWAQYITINDPVPFTLTFGDDALTITPNNQTEPYYGCVTTDFTGSQNIPMGKLKGYSGEGEYWLLVFGATSVEQNQTTVFSKTQTTPFSTAVSITLGDLNGDGKFTIADLTKLIDILQTPSEHSFYTTDNFQFNADMNADKTINTTDVELLRQKVAE